MVDACRSTDSIDSPRTEVDYYSMVGVGVGVGLLNCHKQSEKHIIKWERKHTENYIVHDRLV
jgi:hypothetical protein